MAQHVCHARLITVVRRKVPCSRAQFLPRFLPPSALSTLFAASRLCVSRWCMPLVRATPPPPPSSRKRSSSWRGRASARCDLELPVWPAITSSMLSRQPVPRKLPFASSPPTPSPRLQASTRATAEPTVAVSDVPSNRARLDACLNPCCACRTAADRHQPAADQSSTRSWVARGRHHPRGPSRVAKASLSRHGTPQAS